MDDEAIDHYQDSVCGSVGIDLDEIRKEEREKLLDILDEKCKTAASGWCDNDCHRDPFNDVRRWIADLRKQET